MFKISVRDICAVGIFAAVISVLSPISIPMPNSVPFTLQTLIIPFAAIVLGAKRGTLATIVYLLIGVFGLPVFSSYQGGLGVILGPTGGFLLAFPISALVVGFGADKGHRLWLVGGLAAGIVINYLCGILMYGFVTGSTVQASFAVCMSFVPIDIVKAVLAGILGVKGRGMLGKNVN